MNINAYEINYNPDGTVSTIGITDYNTCMNVEPSQILTVMLNGSMTSQNIRIALYGLDVMICEEMTNIHVPMNRDTKTKVKQYLGLEDVKAPKQRSNSSGNKSKSLTPKQKEAIEKQARLEAERQAYIQKQAAWFEENKRKAEEAKAKGLTNLTDEERRRLRAEMSKK